MKYIYLITNVYFYLVTTCICLLGWSGEGVGLVVFVWACGSPNNATEDYGVFNWVAMTALFHFPWCQKDGEIDIYFENKHCN